MSARPITETTLAEAAGPPTVEPFPIVPIADINDAHPVADFVEGLLTEAGASVLYGPSNCGKSFWILDLAACVATGGRFRDELDVDQGAVVYVALEGRTGVQNRIAALKAAGRLPNSAPLFLCFAHVSLVEHGHADKLAASVKLAANRSALPCRLVILDTLARAMAGADENKGADMTFAVASIDAVRSATSAHVCVVHHCGKDEAKGARGHSSLRAAVDTEIEVLRAEGETISTVRVTKQRDLQVGEPMPFSLRSVELGKNTRGKAITSCLVVHEDSIMAATGKSKAGRKKEYAPDRLLALLPQPSKAAWCKQAEDVLKMSNSSFYRDSKILIDNGQVREALGGILERSNP
jgi:hypothetical protein